MWAMNIMIRFSRRCHVDTRLAISYPTLFFTLRPYCNRCDPLSYHHGRLASSNTLHICMSGDALVPVDNGHDSGLRRQTPRSMSATSTSIADSLWAFVLEVPMRFGQIATSIFLC